MEQLTVDWTKIITNLGISTTGMLVIGVLIFRLSKYFGQKYFDHHLNKSLQDYQTKLERDSKLFENKLNKLSAEHQIQFSKLHELRAEKISEIYSKLWDLESALNEYTTMWQGPGFENEIEKERLVKNRIEETVELYLKNRIYFSVKICESIDLLIGESKTAVSQMRLAKDAAARNELKMKTYNPPSEKDSSEMLKRWEKAEKIVVENIKETREKLEEEFRYLLGVKDSKE